MGPLHFDEFLLAIGAKQEYQILNQLTLNNMHLIPDSVHQHLLALVRRYTLTGGNEIIPVEVKSGNKGSIKSLHSYIIKKQAQRGIRISSNKPLVEQLTARQNKIEREFELINLPFDLLNQIERLLR